MIVNNDNTSILLFLAILPVLLILLFVYTKDKNKEPKMLLLKLFISGFISCGLVLFFSAYLERISDVFSPITSKDFFGKIMYAFIGVALVEEISKWIMVYLVGYNNKEFDELYDGLVYAVFVSLGFAFVENLVYVFVSSSIYTAVVRALCAVPSHACDAIFMGHHISIAKQYSIKRNKKKERIHLLLSLLMPTFIHGVYDFCLLSGYKILIIVFIIFIVVMYFISLSTLNESSTSNKNIKKISHRYCKYCGEIINQLPVCPKCKRKQYMIKKKIQKDVK